MTTSDTNEIQSDLSKPSVLPYQAAATGQKIFLLSTVNSDRTDIPGLVACFRTALRRWGLEGVVQNQIDYATRLADDEGDLLYEEMHKLFSLRDEVYGLIQIGIPSEEDRVEQLDTSMRFRFKRQREMAQLVAQDCAADWSQSLWWYSENLG